MGGCSRGHGGMLLGCFFESGAKDKGRSFHALEGQRCFFMVEEAGDSLDWLIDPSADIV